MGTRTAVIIDLVLVAVFALVGRASHTESLTLVGVGATAWPFLTALVVGWVVLLVRRRPGVTVTAGVWLWLVTVVGGMLLRVGSGDTAALPFVVVATLVLALFLVGWRLLAGRLSPGRRLAVRPQPDGRAG